MAIRCYTALIFYGGILDLRFEKSYVSMYYSQFSLSYELVVMNALRGEL